MVIIIILTNRVGLKKESWAPITILPLVHDTSRAIPLVFTLLSNNTRQNNLGEKVFILAHDFRGFSSWSAGPMHLDRTSWQLEHVKEERCSLHGRQETERETRRGRDKIPPRTHPSDPLLPAWSHLLKFPQPLKIAPPPGDQKYSTCISGGHFIVKPQCHFTSQVCHSSLVRCGYGYRLLGVSGGFSN
jgi:hypothetical protein